MVGVAVDFVGIFIRGQNHIFDFVNAYQIAVDVIADFIHYFQNRLARGFNEVFCNLFLQTTSPFVGNLRRNGVDFFIDKVFDFRLLNVPGKKTQQVLGKILRQVNPGVVFPRTNPVNHGFF